MSRADDTDPVGVEQMIGTTGTGPGEPAGGSAELSVQLEASERRFRQLAGLLPDAAVAWFDRDLRLVVVEGDAIRADGDDPLSMQGKLLTDTVSANLLVLIERPYLDALDGQSSDVEYVSPVNGRRCHLRVQPVRDAEGNVVGGVSVTVDVTEDRARLVQLGQVRQLTQLGFGAYDARTGWSFDPELMRLWGFDGEYDSDTFRHHLIVPEDRERNNAAWDQIYAHGGQVTTEYRMHHGVSGQLRYVECMFSGELGPDGQLLQGVVTHIDVTGSVTSREAAHAAELGRMADRSALLRQVSDLLGTAPGGIAEIEQGVTDLAAAVLGEGALLRVFAPDPLHVDRNVASHRDPARREALQKALDRATSAPRDPDLLARAEVVAGGPVWSNGDGPLVEKLRQAFCHVVDAPVRQFIVAPARHAGVVLALLAVFRTDPDSPYEVGDDDVMQILADRLGGAIAAGLADHAVEAERLKRIAVADRLDALSQEQLKLLDQLAATEARERSLLAEAVHDDPLQLIVAAIMRMDMLRLQFPEREAQEMDGIASLLETSVDQLRQLIVALAPMDLSDGLGSALHRLAQGIFVGTTSAVHLEGPMHVHLTPAAKTAAYRVVREALVNARKHACAPNVTISLSDAFPEVLITITDDGVGARTLDAGSGHLGMGSMRSRAKAVGGTMQITSTLGHGTSVVLSLPAVPREALAEPETPGQPEPAGRMGSSSHVGTSTTAGREHS